MWRSRPKCNCCGDSDWQNQGSRLGVRCGTCNSLERTRILKLFLDKLDIVRPGVRVLHFAPEAALTTTFLKTPGLDYDPVDFEPERFTFCSARKFDLCQDAETLETESYDIIIHSHVMEHIPCNCTAVLWHLHRALKPDGYHFLCVPFMAGHSEEDYRVRPEQEAIVRFGQKDHVRRFGTDDAQRNLGMVFSLPENPSLTDWFSERELDKYNIPARERTGFTGSIPFPLRKNDLKLR